MTEVQPERVPESSALTPEDLWDALTSKERLPRWFAQVDGDLQLGGRFQVKGNAGGTITACAPPKSFSATWEFGGGVSWIKAKEMDRSVAVPKSQRFLLVF